MAERVPVYEPELEELLLEVAANPSSLLMRAPQREGVVGPLDLEEGVSVRTAGLTVAEREVLGRWRERAAELLRQEFNRSLDAEGRGDFVVEVDLRNEKVRRPIDHVISERIDELNFVGRPRATSKIRIDVLTRVLGGQRILPSDRRPLIVLSHRLRPSDKTRICLAALEYRAGRLQRSLAMYRSIYERSVATETRAFAVANSIPVFKTMKNPARQRGTADHCMSIAPKWAFSNVRHTRVSLELGLAEATRSGIARTCDLGPPGTVLLEHDLEWLVRECRETGRFPPRKVRSAARAVADTTDGRIQDLMIQLAGLQ